MEHIDEIMIFVDAHRMLYVNVRNSWNEIKNTLKEFLNLNENEFAQTRKQIGWSDGLRTFINLYELEGVIDHMRTKTNGIV